MLYRIIGFLLPCIRSFIFHSQSKTNSVESMIHFVDGDVLRGENVPIEEGRLILSSYGQKLIFGISEVEKIDDINGIRISEDLLILECLELPIVITMVKFYLVTEPRIFPHFL